MKMISEDKIIAGAGYGAEELDETEGLEKKTSCGTNNMTFFHSNSIY